MSRQVDTGYGQINTQSWGYERYPERAPVVLLHDSLGCISLWRQFPEQLLNCLKRPIIAYDRLGFGLSDKREALPNLDFVEEEARLYFPRIKAALGLKEYVILGHSVGGAMAVEIGASDPDCLAVITLAAQAFVEERTLDGIRVAKELFQQEGQIEKLERWHGNKSRWVLDAWTDTWLNPNFKNWHLTAALNSLKIPVLAIHGEQDEYGSVSFPQYISDQSSGLCEQVIIPNCAHNPHRTDEDLVLGCIKQFLETNLKD